MTGSIFEKGQFTTDQEKAEYFRMMQEIRRMASEVRFGSCEYMKDNICLMTKTDVHCDGCSRFSITRADMMKGIVKYFHYLESEIDSHKKTIAKLEKDISIYAREAKVHEGEIVLKNSKIEMLEKQNKEITDKRWEAELEKGNLQKAYNEMKKDYQKVLGITQEGDDKK